MDWYYIHEDKQVGPVSLEAFEELIHQGIIQEQTPVWRDSMSSWQPYLEIATTLPINQVLGAAPPLAPAACSLCGQRHAARDLIPFEGAWICAACKPVLLQRLKEGAAAPGILAYGGFWIRLCAFFLDTILVSAAVLFIGTIWTVLAVTVFKQAAPDAFPLGPVILLFFVLPAVYEIVLVGKYGTTVGKRICRLRVIAVEGYLLTYSRSAGRHFAKYLGALTYYVGFIVAGLDKEKRALHDFICGTRVIKM